MSTAVATVNTHPEKYEKNFEAVAQYIDKRAPTLNVKVESVTQTRPVKWQKISTSRGPFKGKMKLKKYSREE